MTDAPDLEPDPLVRALLPVLLHKLGNSTQLLTGLNAMLSFDDGAALVASRAEDITRAGDEIERLGWLLAVLGSAAGEDLLLARRSPDGLEWMIELLRDGCRRDGRPLAEPSGALPRLAPGALGGWEVAWAVARLLLAARGDAAGSEPLPWSLAPAGGAQRLEVAGGPGLAAAVRLVQPRLSGSEAHVDEDGRLRLDLPGDWFQ